MHWRYHSTEIWKQLDSSPWQCVLSQVSCRAVVLVVNNQIPTIPQLPYSPDVALCDFWVFARIKTGLKDHHLCLQNKFNRMQLQASQPYQNRISRGAYNNGQTTGAGVCVQKGSIWRVTRLDFKHILLATNNTWVLGTFLSFHAQDGW